jgi:hypothetical protein
MVCIYFNKKWIKEYFMKMKTFFLGFLLFGFVFTSCATSNVLVSPDAEIHTFKATILEIHDNYVVVIPLEGEDILRSSDRISFGMVNLNEINASIGDVVNVQYKGGIRESYPSQVSAISWSILSE